MDVYNALQRRGALVFFLDQRKVLNVEMQLAVDVRIDGLLGIGDETCDLASVRSVYLRHYDSRRLPDIQRAGEQSAAWQHAETIDGMLGSWLEVTPALVINPLSAMASNNSKPYQSSVICSFGFATPDTLITTDAEAAQEFWERHKVVVYKSMSGVRSIVSRLTTEHVHRLNDLQWCPTQFQQYIPGREYRVHVVGHDVFACEIDSNTDDYRYAWQQGGYARLKSCCLPAECVDRCRALTAHLGLVVAGLDLRQTPEGRWYCFEVNTSPAFSYYAAATGQPIADAVASVLAA